MELSFNVNYRTNFGEEVVLNILTAEGVEKYRMMAADGQNWSVHINWHGEAADEATGTIDYFFSIERDGQVERQEWQAIRHRLELEGAPARVTVYSQWQDRPDDSHLYTSAFTDCINIRKHHRPASAQKAQLPARAVRLIVRAPQLRSPERLGIIGAQNALGSWESTKAVNMFEHNYNEWTADLNAADFPDGRMEFKFAALDARKDVTPLWENGGNHTILLPQIGDGEMVVYELAEAHMPIYNARLAGTLVPVFSLRSRDSFGVGDFGDLRKMVAFVAQTGQHVLQVLPVNDTTTTHTWTDSYPYSCISVFALHPQYVDLTQLPPLADAKLRKEMGKLRQELNALDQIDYERVNNAKMRYLRALYRQDGGKTLATTAFRRFFHEAESWLVPYAQYCALRDKYGTADFSQWPDHNRWDEGDRKTLTRKTGKAYQEVAFWYYVQYILDSQLSAVHEYARQQHVILKGDIPIGVSRYGCDVWAEPRYFNLNGQAGAPPDAFSTEGQNWGFPTYNWDEMLADGLQWWTRRLQHMARFFDAYRIDHILGFFRIWEIPVGTKSGLMGQFSPALALTKSEIEGYGFRFDEEKYCKSGTTEVLFLHDRKNAGEYHPRIAAQYTQLYASLSDDQKAAFNRLYDDYFYRRNNQFWYQEAMKKLPAIVQSTRMLACAEDLGMVPECVPWVMNELHILSLEVQSMPKDPHVRFGHLSRNPYRSVCTFSTHDMPTLRQWWDEDEQRTQEYYNTMLYREGSAPHPLPGWLSRDILSRQLTSPSMLCVLSLQDWLSMDERLRREDANAERINVPADPHHYWRYRMHINIEDLSADSSFTQNLRDLIYESDR